MQKWSATGRKSDAAVRLGYIAQRVLIYAVIASGAVLFCVPLWWMVTTSLKPLADVFLFPPQVIPARASAGPTTLKYSGPSISAATSSTRP